MEKNSQYRYILVLVLILVPLYFSTLFLHASPTYFLAIIIIWAISLPLISYFHYSYIYVLSLPAPLFGSWFLLTNLLVKYVEFSGYWALVATVLSTMLVFAFHRATRSKTMFWNFLKSGLSRSSIAAASAIFLSFGAFVLNPSVFTLGFSSEIFYFLVALIAYIASSMLYINYQFRVFALNNKIGVTNVQRKLTQYWRRLKKSFQIGNKTLICCRESLNSLVLSLRLDGKRFV